VEVAEARCREPGPTRLGGYVGRGADTRNMRETHQTCKTHSEDEIFIFLLFLHNHFYILRATLII